MANTHLSALQLDGQGGSDSAGLLGGAGTAADPATTATADQNFLDFRFESEATSGDARGIYNRLYIAGAGGGGESLRAFTTVNNVTGATAHGAHISLNFGTSGKLTGQGIACRNTLHIPNASLGGGNVTYAALQAEIYSDGADSDPNGNLLSYLRVVNGGNATGGADVDDDAALIEIVGHTIGAGNMIVADNDETKFSHKIRIRIAGTDYYLMATAT